MSNIDVVDQPKKKINRTRKHSLNVYFSDSEYREVCTRAQMFEGGFAGWVRAQLLLDSDILLEAYRAREIKRISQRKAAIEAAEKGVAQSTQAAKHRGDHGRVLEGKSGGASAQIRDMLRKRML
jgi:hypothetical protein